jgi:hypothetical protein
LLAAAPGHAGDGVKAFERRGKRAHLGLDAGIELRDLLVQELDVGQEPLPHEAVVVGDAAPQLKGTLIRDRRSEQ